MVTIAQIIAATSEHYRIPKDVLLGPRRERQIARPRQVAMYLCRVMTDHSYPEIGRDLGRDGRAYDHTTVSHAFRRIERLCADDEKTRDSVATIRKRASAARLSTSLEFVSPERTA